MNIYFRALEIEDATLINNLRKIEEMENLIGGAKRFVSLEREKEWVKSLILSDDPTRMYLAVCTKVNNEFIGYTSISNIDYRNGSCFWSGIKLLKEYSGKGLGKETALLILKYVFEEMRMERCTGEALEEHTVIIHLLESIGFKKEGLMRNYNYKNGSYKNTWLFSMLRNEYEEIKLKFKL